MSWIWMSTLWSTAAFLLLACLLAPALAGMGGIYLAIDTTAGERERRTLEPLLTTPVSRTSLLLGKVSATTVFMLVSLALALVGFGIATPYLPLDELGEGARIAPAGAAADTTRPRSTGDSSG